ncbi:MAG: hypothetical protein LBT90_03575 [Holosporaceae bacterium]|nr:hypothetical protein [Holosporaceae bacterium]
MMRFGIKMRKIGKRSMKNTGKAIINLLKNMKKSVYTMTYDNGKDLDLRHFCTVNINRIYYN